MVVFAFDRDWTVDVNPPPDRTAVPLAWIQHLAHETTHPVYAIGNQLLVDEAGIPGVEAILDGLEDAARETQGASPRDGRWPERRDRLALIDRLHPDADRFVVVDDVDLSDVQGWDHYYAWDFVPAVKRGEIDPSGLQKPWTKASVSAINTTRIENIYELGKNIFGKGEMIVWPTSTSGRGKPGSRTRRVESGFARC